MQNYRPQLFCFPYLRQNRGVHPSKNVGAPTFSLSFLPVPTLGPLAFQSVAHSFIFRIQPIFWPPSIFRTLAPKTGGTPPLVQPIPRSSYEVRSFLFALSCRLSTVAR